jgi:hypothetical protein
MLVLARYTPGLNQGPRVAIRIVEFWAKAQKAIDCKCKKQKTLANYVPYAFLG